MSDLISRQAAIEALNKLDVSDGVGISSVACDLQEEAIRSIKNLPSVQGWIPVTERLPEEYGDYLVDVVGYEPQSIVIAKYGMPYCIMADDERICFYISEEFDYPLEAKAWMPLPEPYKERTDETD